jgi:hypothetical protein
MDSRVKDPDEALYNLITDPDEKSNVYLDPEFQCIIDDMCNLVYDWTAGTNRLIDWLSVLKSEFSYVKITITQSVILHI